MTAIPTAPEAFLNAKQGQFYPPTFQIVRHLVDFLQWRFSKLPPGAYQWCPEGGNSETGEGQSEIFISADTPIDPVNVGQRPAVTVLRSQAAFNGVGLNDRAFVALSTGAEVKMDLLPTTIMVNFLSQQPVEAERLAWFGMEQIWAFREEIIKTLPCLLYMGQRPALSAPSPAGSLVASTDHEWVVVVCSIPTYLQHVVTKEPLNKPIVNGFTVNATTTSPPKLTPTVTTQLLQGTAPSQPKQARPSKSSRVSAVAGSGDLPQEGGDEASSSEPLTVTIET